MRKLVFLAAKICFSGLMSMLTVAASAQDSKSSKSTAIVQNNDQANLIPVNVLGNDLVCYVLYRNVDVGNEVVIHLFAKKAVEGEARIAAWALDPSMTTSAVTWRQLSLLPNEVVEFVMLETANSHNPDLFGKITINGRSRNCY